MRKTGLIVLCLVILILCYFTFVSAEAVFRSEWQVPKTVSENQKQPRLVLITQDTETPFWDKVGHGAMEQAKKEGASLEIWGSYGNNHEDFLKKLEIAIHSKVDGIIIQGLDTEEFKYLAKVKASFYGIPIITVANDVPVTESLRRTYVGSDQCKAGSMLAMRLVADMGTSGKVLLTYSSNEEYYQKQRLEGIQNVLSEFPSIETIYAETSSSREEIIATTRNVLNNSPNVDAIISVNSNIIGALVQEISKRSQVEPYYIYSFDDAPESLSLLKQGKIDGMIEQSPEMMGKTSVELIVEWLNGETVPLDFDGYYTNIRILKAADVQ
ncbi:sugar ABC transporter substrate-binding protein [Robertmurraya andreesenii]|uniref:Ribose transport system substrate-binding protein n=1 Tax=Anoxybacillus andreesenii TaxID=1325932 RepID=A0ABT9UZB4_9BACL|nr:substrate-binding domain-containing protein [Robertmurraya andreesenii]MDQ0154041.1 ribose transport system substrate-binding protein [Robertmurraya andreesenii]